MSRSYLATDDAFQFVRGLQQRNRIVPVVGDFGGPTALRRVGDFARAHNALVHAFYASNVAVYLTNQQRSVFCASLAALPAAPRAVFVESNTMRSLAARVRACGLPTDGGPRAWGGAGDRVPAAPAPNRQRLQRRR